MSLAARSIRSALFLSLSTLANIGVGFIGGIVLARLLTPNDFGTYALAITINAFADLRLKLYLEQKFLRDRDERPAFVGTFFLLGLALAVISLALMILVAVGAAWFGRLDLAGCLVALGALSLLTPVHLTLRLQLEKKVVFGRVALIEVLSNLMQFVVTLLAALAGWGMWSLVLGAFFNTLLNLGLLWLLSPARLNWHWDSVLAREFLAYGLKYGVVFATSGVVLTQFDNLTLGILQGTNALGYYDRAYRTSSWPTILVSAALGRISLPTYAQLQNDSRRLERAFSLVLWLVFTLTTPLALAIFVTAPELVPVLYGARWLPAVPVLQVLAAFAVCRPLWDDMISVLVATGRPGLMARIVFYQALALIVVVLPLTWRLGAVGTALSAGVAFLLSTGYLLYFARRELHVDLWRAAGLPLLNSALMVIGYFLVRSLLRVNTFAPLTALVVEGGLVVTLYLAFSLLTSRRAIQGNFSFLLATLRRSDLEAVSHVST